MMQLLNSPGFETAMAIASSFLIVAGTFFFTAGTIGLIRFPDVRNQLHALTKADNLGLGLILLGAALYFRDLSTSVILLLSWLLILGAASVSAHALGAEESAREDAKRES